MKSIPAILLVSFALSAPFAALAESATPALETLAVASANEPAEHRALADFYRSQAAEERSQAARHRFQARHVTGGKLFQTTGLKSQHTARARQLDASAQAHEDLAVRHDAAARAAEHTPNA